jgi:hypothetical protein
MTRWLSEEEEEEEAGAFMKKYTSTNVNRIAKTVIETFSMQNTPGGQRRTTIE